MGWTLINTIINIKFLIYEQKITTLLASAMLATAFSAGASINAKKGEATLLGASSNYLSVNTENNYGALSL